MYPTTQDVNNVVSIILLSILLGTLIGYAFNSSRNEKKNLKLKVEEIQNSQVALNGTVWGLMEDRYNNTIEDIDYILNNMKNVQNKFSTPFYNVEVIPVSTSNPKIADLINQLKAKSNEKDWFDDYLNNDL